MLDDPKVIAKRIRSAVTDAEREIRYDPEHKPGVSNLLSIYAALTGRAIADLETDYAGKGYGDLKGDLADVVVGALTPVRERVLGYLESPGDLDDILADGALRARAIARGTLARVYDAVGLLPGARA